MSGPYEPLASSDSERAESGVAARREHAIAHLHAQELEELCATTSVPNATVSSEEPEPTVCTTPGCVLSAANLLSSLDPAADPCQDFHRYACGRWAEAHPRPGDRASWNAFGRAGRAVAAKLRSVLRSQPSAEDGAAVGAARLLFRHCTNTTDRDLAGVAPLTSALERIGGWPAASEAWHGQDYSWPTAATLSAIYTGDTQLITLTVSADEKNVTRHLIHVDQAMLGLQRGVLTDP
ncbi:neprilysin-11-like, partial [Pollicipes pollicipes]|uniref:neprilysin-11-like n=1 Tax=Pollicipes pollicipes TaxID=41117 RepID=UPI001884B547